MRSTSPHPMRTVITGGGLLLVYWCIGLASMQIAVDPNYASIPWAPAGVALAALVILGIRYWPIIWIGTVLLLLPSMALPVALTLATGASAAPLVGAVLLNRLQFDRHLRRTRDVVLLITVGILLSQTICATTAISIQLVSGRVVLTEAPAAWFAWYSGDAIGTLLVTPVIMTWAGIRIRDVGLEHLLRALVVAAITVIVAVLAFFQPFGPDVSIPLAYLPMPLLLWVVIRYGVMGGSAATLAICLPAGWATSVDLGPFVNDDYATATQLLFVYIVVIAVSTLMLGALVDERTDTHRRLSESEERHRRIVETAHEGIWVVDADRRTTFANDHMAAMLGTTVDDMMEQDVQRYVDAETFDLNETSSRDVRLIRPDGMECWGLASTAPLRTAEGAFAGALLMVTNITSRRQAEGYQRLLTNELDHRVKNNLATIIALAEQMVRPTESVPDYSQRFVARLRSMAVAHELLASDRWEGSGLGPLIERLVGDHNVHATGPPLTIAAQAIQPLAMIVHELFTNACKYGALSEAGGVSIDWSHDADSGWLQIRWREHDGPQVAPPTRHGMGTLLIEQLAEYQLRGHSDLRFDQTGVTCTLDLPAPTIERAPREQTATPECHRQ